MSHCHNDKEFTSLDVYLGIHLQTGLDSSESCVHPAGHQLIITIFHTGYRSMGKQYVDSNVCPGLYAAYMMCIFNLMIIKLCGDAMTQN